MSDILSKDSCRIAIFCSNPKDHSLIFLWAFISQQLQRKETLFVFSRFERPLAFKESKNVHWYQLDQSVSSFLDAHKFVYNISEVFNVDYLLDLEGSWISFGVMATLRPGVRVLKESPARGMGYAFRKFFYNRLVKSFFDDQDLENLIKSHFDFIISDKFKREKGYQSKSTDSQSNVLFQGTGEGQRVFFLNFFLSSNSQVTNQMECISQIAPLMQEDAEMLLVISKKVTPDKELLNKIEEMKIRFCYLEQEEVFQLLQRVALCLTDDLSLFRLCLAREIPTCYINPTSHMDFPLIMNFPFSVAFTHNGEFFKFWRTASESKNLVGQLHLIDCLNEYLDEFNVSKSNHQLELVKSPADDN